MFQKEKAKVPRFRYTPLKGFGVMAPGLEPPDSDSVSTAIFFFVFSPEGTGQRRGCFFLGR